MPAAGVSSGWVGAAPPGMDPVYDSFGQIVSYKSKPKPNAYGQTAPPNVPDPGNQRAPNATVPGPNYGGNNAALNPYGPSISQNQYEQERLLALQNQYATDRSKANNAALQGLLGSMSSGGGSAPEVQYDAASADAARAAAFTNAKQQAGRLATAALRNTLSTSSGRGTQGSSIERGAIGDIIGGAAGGLQDVVRGQAINDAQAIQDRANTIYSGRIAQRDQTLNAQTSLKNAIIAGLRY